MNLKQDKSLRTKLLSCMPFFALALDPSIQGCNKQEPEPSQPPQQSAPQQYTPQSTPILPQPIPLESQEPQKLSPNQIQEARLLTYLPFSQPDSQSQDSRVPQLHQAFYFPKIPIPSLPSLPLKKSKPAPLPNDYHLHVAPDLDKTPQRPNILQVPVEVEIRQVPETKETPEQIDAEKVAASFEFTFPLVHSVINERTGVLARNYEIPYQRGGGQGVIDNALELERVVTAISSHYKPHKSISKTAFENFVASSGANPGFAGYLEQGLQQPTDFDRFADFVSAYKRGNGLVAYRDCKRGLHVITSKNKIKDLKTR